VDAHRVEVLDGTDDDAVALPVAHHLHLVFLPAEERFLDQHLRVERGVETALHNRLELRRVVRDAAARAAEREAGADDERPGADLPRGVLRLVERVARNRSGHVEAERQHRLLEEFAVLGARNGIRIRADHLHLVAAEDALARDLHRDVERGLSAQGRQQRVGALPADDFVDRLGRDRLDVGVRRHFRVGHDRRGVRVDEHDLVALVRERLDGLHARIVELAALADDDRPRADQQDLVDVGTLHVRKTLANSMPYQYAMRR